MTEALQILLDKQAISEGLADYARGADRIDVDLLKSVFHPEAVADYGAMFTGTGHEFAEFLGAVHPSMETHHHQLGSIAIRVDGDRAGSETYVIARLRFRNEDGSLTDITSYGRYVDLWERREDRWRILRRRYLHHMDQAVPTPGGSYPTSGARDLTDPVYGVLAP
jgi:hypothetical protein